MPKGLCCQCGLAHLHFVECSCDPRLPLFVSVRATNLFVNILGEAGDRYGFPMGRSPIMPEHVYPL
jgi:hypothetical protein